MGVITPKSGQFYNGDFSGWSTTKAVGISTPAGGWGYGTSDSGGERPYSADQVGISPAGTIGGGGMVSSSYTW